MIPQCLYRTKLTYIFVLLLSVQLAYAQSSSKLFELVSANKTNIQFSNTIEDTKEKNILIYDNFYAGSGVGVGDFNNDGLQDIYFGGNLVSDRLYLNKGNFEFTDITNKAGITDDGGWSSGITVADVNNDGLADIYVSRELYDDTPELWRNKLYINNGDLTFTDRAREFGLADTVRSRHATFFDYDIDGDLDVFVLNQPPNPGKYSKHLGMSDTGELLSERFSPRLYENVNNRFIDISQKAGVLRAGFCNSAVVSDLNNDGWPDIYVANDFEAPDFLYINNQDGTFTNKANSALKHIPFFSMGVDIADINNDALPDILVVDMSAEDNYRSKVNMSGMNPEKFWGVVNKGWHYQYMYNSLQLNNGNEHFGDIGQLTGIYSTDWSWSPLLIDLDNDGNKDVYITNGLLRDIRNNDADKKLKQYINSKIMAQYEKSGSLDDVDIWDLIDLKEALDIYPSQKISNYVFKNHGGLNFSKEMKDWGLDQLTFSSGSAYADFDNDGDLDLVVNNTNDKASIYKNNSDKISGSNYLRVKLLNQGKSVSSFGAKATIRIGDKMQYQELSNTRGIFSTSESIFHFGIGDIDNVESLDVVWPDGNTIKVKNVSPNQLLRLDYSNSKNGSKVSSKNDTRKREDKTPALEVKHEENDFDDYEREPLLPHKLSSLGPTLAAGDVNGDGLDDFFIGGSSGKSGDIYIQQSSGKFETLGLKPWLQDFRSEDSGACFFDIDNDKDLDLYVVSGSNEFAIGSRNYQDRLYINDGRGGFIRSNDLPMLRDSGSIAIPKDFDNDGDMDLFVGGRQVPGKYPSPASSRLLRNDSGKLTDVTAEAAAGFVDLGIVTDAVWTDFNSDGYLDLIVVGEWMPITFFLNDNGTFINVTDQYGDSKKIGWWFSIVAQDFDSDGDDDYVVGNIGLNYKYKASDKEPFDIYYNDFDLNGNGDIVLGYNVDGKSFPVRGRECSSQQIPSIKETFTNYQSFAVADLFDVYGKSNLNSSLHYSATTFASTYIENKGRDQVFDFKELPKASQLSSINDILVEDLNDDGKADLIVAGNFYGSEVETPRNDASYGLVLLGDSKGNFKAINPNESGLYLDGDIKHMKTIFVNGEKYILLAKNNDKMELVKLDLKLPNL